MSVWVLPKPRPGAFFGPRPGRKGRIFRIIFGGLLTLGAMGGLAAALLDPPDFIVEAAGKPPAQSGEWVEIVKPFQLYALPSAAFGTEPRHVSARRHTADRSRTDTLVYGAEQPGKGNWLRIEIRRLGAGAAPVPLYADFARLAARAASSISRTSLPTLAQTRFGPVEINEIQLASGNRHSACLGFRVARQEPGIEIAGLACGTPARPITQQTLVCTLDRLDLLASGEDREIGAFFAKRELQRGQACPALARTAQKLDKPGWLDPADQALPLKGSLTLADARNR